MTLTFYCCALIKYKVQCRVFHRQQVIIISYDTIERTRTKLWHIVDSYCIGTYYNHIHSGSGIILDTVPSPLPRALNISIIFISRGLSVISKLLSLKSEQYYKQYRTSRERNITIQKRKIVSFVVNACVNLRKGYV